MLAGQSQNLREPLKQAEAAYRGPAARLSTVARSMLAQRAGHFAAGVHLALEQPGAMRRLREVSTGLRGASSLSTLLPSALDGALALMGADFGNIQICDPVTSALHIVTHSGFDSEFLDYFAVVDDDHSACGRAAKAGAQTVITDVSADPDFAPHRDVAGASGFCAVQSTPLADHVGRMVGVISTHFRSPYRPPDLDLRIMELYADLAGEAIARHLGVLDGDVLGDPAGQAVIPALFGPGDGQEPGVTVASGQEDGQDDRAPGPALEAAFLAGPMSQFAEHVVNGLFSVGLRLESARSIVGKGPAGDRVAAATDEVDCMIRDIRTMMFSRATDGTAPTRERMVQTARALRAAAADAAALLEQQADLARHPKRMDYPTEIKRWRAFADQAAQMAQRWGAGTVTWAQPDGRAGRAVNTRGRSQNR